MGTELVVEGIVEIEEVVVLEVEVGIESLVVGNALAGHHHQILLISGQG